MDYVELEFYISPQEPWTEIVTTLLSEIGFESFTEYNQKLQAFVQKENYNDSEVQSILEEYNCENVSINYTKKIIPHQNWNETWEESFEPVEVDDELLIYAPFHEVNKKFKYTIEIQPQMSFGTGHHQTTWLLSKRMMEMDFKNKKVLDVGTGTGVLAILAKQLDAASCVTTEIDKGSCENARENFARNRQEEIFLIEEDIEAVQDKDFDIIIANINKNVLTNHLPFYAERIKEKGRLLLSGFFETDADELILSAKKCNFIHFNTFVKESWAVMEFTKS